MLLQIIWWEGSRGDVVGGEAGRGRGVEKQGMHGACGVVG